MQTKAPEAGFDADQKMRQVDEQLRSLLERISQVEMAQVAAKPLELPDSKVLLIQSQIQTVSLRLDEVASSAQLGVQTVKQLQAALAEAEKRIVSLEKEHESSALQGQYIREKIGARFDDARIEQLFC